MANMEKYMVKSYNMFVRSIFETSVPGECIQKSVLFL